MRSCLGSCWGTTVQRKLRPSSPYQIMHGQLPTLPARLRPRLEQVIDFDDPRVAERELLERGKLVQELCIMAKVVPGVEGVLYA